MNTDLIVDKLIFKDVQLTATNDDQYFVFEDIIYQVSHHFFPESTTLKNNLIILGDALLFSWHWNHGNGKNWFHQQFKSEAIWESTIWDNTLPWRLHVCCPILLFVWLTTIPLLYISRVLYSILPPIDYGQHTSSGHSLSVFALWEIVANSRAWIVDSLENWAQYSTVSFFLNFLESVTLIYYFSIRVVFKWLMRAFSGHLQPEQLLVLWDLILAYDSLEILSLLSVIILSFRKESLMQVNTLDNIEAVLADLSSVKVLPLIQLALSRD